MLRLRTRTLRQANSPHAHEQNNLAMMAQPQGSSIHETARVAWRAMMVPELASRDTRAGVLNRSNAMLAFDHIPFAFSFCYSSFEFLWVNHGSFALFFLLNLPVRTVRVLLFGTQVMCPLVASSFSVGCMHACWIIPSFSNCLLWTS
jgi:hypothetical protein